MEKQIAKLEKDLIRLKWYAGILTLLLITTILFAFTGYGIFRFKELSAERINIHSTTAKLTK